MGIECLGQEFENGAKSFSFEQSDDKKVRAILEPIRIAFGRSRDQQLEAEPRSGLPSRVMLPNQRHKTKRKRGARAERKMKV